MGIPYIRVEAANHPFVRAADGYLKSRDAVDAALIFGDKVRLDQSLYYIIGNSFLRIIGAQMEDTEALTRLKNMRPRPSNYVAWGSTSLLKSIYQKAKNMNMVKRDTKWTLVFNDFQSHNFMQNSLMDMANLMSMTADTCCIILDKSSGGNKT
jgi:hypothetical protein